MDSSFREQCFLYPWIKQRQDLFGTTVAVSGQFVAVGAPNRDTIHGYLFFLAVFSSKLVFMWG